MNDSTVIGFDTAINSTGTSSVLNKVTIVSQASELPDKLPPLRSQTIKGIAQDLRARGVQRADVLGIGAQSAYAAELVVSELIDLGFDARMRGAVGEQKPPTKRPWEFRKIGFIEFLYIDARP